MQSPQPITLFEKLGLPVAVFRALGHVFIKAILGIFQRQRPVFKRYMLYELLKALTVKQSIRQLQYINGSTSANYQAFCTATGNEEKIVEIGNGCKGLWLGEPDAKNVFIFYHGGGFIVAADVQHFHFLQDILRSANASGANLAIFLPTYTLVQEGHRYPTQVRQCVEALGYILKTGRKPENIVIGGDSAGCQVSLAVLSHISRHPHPDIAPLDLIEGQDLKAFIGLSPWVSYREDFKSYNAKAGYDFLSLEYLSPWGKEYKGKAPSDEYNEPLTADEKWWIGVKTEKMLLVAGENEILIDSIEELVGKMKAAIPEKLTYVSAPGMAHDGVIFDRMVGYTDIGVAGQAMVDVLVDAFCEK